MNQIKPTPRKILDRRVSLVWELHCEGYSDIEIGEILNGLERTWVYRLRKRMPKGWKQAWSKAHKNF